jgi:plastocyanin
LHASNVAVNTIQGSSRGSIPVAGATDKPLFGFEFTIPLQLKRFGPWFGKGGKAGGAAAVGAATPSGADVVAEVRMGQFRFTPDSVVIAVGQAIRWVNADPVEHTVTFAASGPAGSGTMPANGSFVARFDQPGTYRYTCTPHPYMKGVVVVQ